MIGEKLYNLRRDKKISQEEFAYILKTSRQAVSKWERNESNPDIEKLVEIAKLFNVSIDYLLGHEIHCTNVDKFIDELRDSFINNKLSININDIRLWCSKYPNNFKLHTYSTDYLYFAYLDNHNEEYLDLALSCLNKSIALFTPEYNEIISLNNLYKAVSEIYLTQQKYELAKENIKKNNISGCELILAKCDLSLKNNDLALETASEIYLESTSNIINASYIQVIALLRNKKIKEAYDLVNWTMSFINSIKNNDEFFEGILYPFITFKALTEKLLNIDNIETMKILKSINANTMNYLVSPVSGSVKYYHGKAESLLSTNSNIENIIKEIISQTSKEDIHYQTLIDMYKEIFGGDINE